MTRRERCSKVLWISTTNSCTGDVGSVNGPFDWIVYERMIETGSNETYIQLSAVVASSDEDQPITVRSAPKLFSGLNYGGAAFTTLTAVIKMDHGVVESISWDDGCHRCLSSSCGDNTVVKRNGVLMLIREDDEEYGAYAGENCYTSASKCTKTQGTCDFQLFVVWSGTDARGQVLQSTNLRISRFQKGSIESIMNEL